MPANRPAEPVRRRCYIILCTPAPRRKQPRRPALGDDFNIEGESVDSSALQRELARRVEARRASGAYSPEVESLLAERLPDEEEFGKLPAIAELDYAATRAMSSVSYTHLRAHETRHDLVCRLLLEKKKKKKTNNKYIT